MVGQPGRRVRFFPQQGLSPLLCTGVFLSGDLLQFLVTLLDVTPKKRTKSQWTFLSVAQSIEFQDHAFYAPRPGYKGKSACTLLRNPHIARNEEILLDPYRPVE